MLDPASETESRCGFAAESAFNLLISAHCLPLLLLAPQRADVADGVMANTPDATSVSLRLLWAPLQMKPPSKEPVINQR